ncbi:MAG: hypothetical protein IT158_20965 [Bryobacterales bacterium]|nr:hypothetical protein [Bryobacterales bacterium]
MKSPARRETLGAYLCSLPERVLRSVSAVSGGLLREVGEVSLPPRLRRTRLYQSLVESTLRFLIEQIGQVQGAYPRGSGLPRDFLVRRTAGNALEVAGIAAFRASPVWVLAALADVSGAGRDLVTEISETLQQEGLLEPGSSFATAGQLLDGLERTAGRLAETVNTPPLDVATLRQDWAALKEEARRIPAGSLPSPVLLQDAWRQLRQEAVEQHVSVFELSTALAVGAMRGLPDNARWLSRVARVSARRAGRLLAEGLLEHYRTTLIEIHTTGYGRYWMNEFRPYLAGALEQFSRQRVTVTERLLQSRAWRGR